MRKREFPIGISLNPKKIFPVVTTELYLLQDYLIADDDMSNPGVNPEEVVDEEKLDEDDEDDVNSTKDDLGDDDERKDQDETL